MVDTPHADFCIEIDYEKNSPNPSRVFKAMSDLIEALQSVDTTLLEPLPIKIEPILLLEDIETSSIKAWLAQKLETLDDDAVKSGDYKKVIGSYLVLGKYALINFLQGKTEIKSAADIEPLERELYELAEDAYVSRLIPTYTPPSRQRLLTDVNKINSALAPLNNKDTVTFIDNEGRRTGFNLSLWIAPETIGELLTRETITSPPFLMILKVKRPDFLGDAKWEFHYDGRIFLAKIADEGWLKRYHDRLEPLSPGDALRCDVQSTVKYGFDGEVVDTQHVIIKVHGSEKIDHPLQSHLDLSH